MRPSHIRVFLPATYPLPPNSQRSAQAPLTTHPTLYRDPATVLSANEDTRTVCHKTLGDLVTAPIGNSVIGDKAIIV